MIDNLFEQMTNISKAHGYEILAKHCAEQNEIIEQLRLTIKQLTNATGDNWQELRPAVVDMSHLPESLRERDVWRNDIYTVFVSRNQIFEGMPCPITWLSIKRNDKEPCNDWRHFQWIKNQMCGPQTEAVQLYPAESRMVDLSNQYHLWVLADPNVTFPFGFHAGRKMSRKPLQNGKQRQWPDNLLPEDIEELERNDEAIMKHLNLK